MEKYNLLIIGKTPPPIGGVTIHVNRLIEHLENTPIDYNFIELKLDNLFQIFKLSFNSRVVHLHTSNVWLRLLFSLYSWLIRKKLIITYHGNLGRYSFFLNWIDNLSVRLAKIPLVLNKTSFEKAKVINKNVRLIPAFIPPKGNSFIKNDLLIKNEIKVLMNKFSKVYCTNAFDVTFDKDGNEIYGISSLVKLFNSLDDCSLVVSDPSGNYKKYLLGKKTLIKNNIKFLDFHHSFYSVLKLTNGFIRSTSTDGDSLSVKEALFLGKTVYCSDCVDRPQGVISFKTHDYNQLKKLLNNEDYLMSKSQDIKIENGFKKLEKIYLELI